MFLKDYYPKLNKKFVKVIFNGIAFDTREVKKKYIFFAIKGNNINGKKFINHAIKQGATTIISDLRYQGYKKSYFGGMSGLFWVYC